MSLIAHLWQSTLVAAIAALLAIAVRHASARTRYMLWLFASVKFLIPLPLLFAAGSYAGSWLAAVAVPPWWSVGWLETPLVRWSVTSGAGIASGTPLSLDRAWMAAAVAIWVTGAVGLALRRWRAWRLVSGIAATATPLRAGREAEALGRLSAGTGSAGVPLLRCRSTIEPGAFGIFRPKILWPSGLSDRLHDAELEAILSHELCHVRRRDNLTASLQMLVETLFWFHPIVWWIGARMIAERERACDEAVIERGSSRQTYAEGILKVCGFCVRSPLASIAGVAGAGLNQRMEWIMSGHRILPVSLPMRLVIIAIIAGTAGMPLAAGVTAGQQEEAGKVHRKGPGVTLPVLVKETKPGYTPQAVKERIQGSLWLEAVVLTDGTVGDVKVTKSLDAKHGLDDAAVKAIKQWRFKPGTKDKKPVPVAVEVEMSFKLK